ncbi:MAG: hypothetical protein HN400_04050, partial [Nitrospinaceae bacterium]|nr:hypothetical protein [Nitrospinaceae bacterium]
MDTQNWYDVQEFAPNTYMFTEASRWNIFLFIGEEKALVLDGGIGVGSRCWRFGLGSADPAARAVAIAGGGGGCGLAAAALAGAPGAQSTFVFDDFP